MESLIKRNNFSPEDRKILNKIDRHIKELEDRVEQGGGSGGGGTENVKEYDFHIPVNNIPLANSLTDYEDYVNYYDDYVPFNEQFLMIDPLNINFEQGSIVNVYLNDKFYKKCRMINVESQGLTMKAIFSKEYYDLMVAEEAEGINNDKLKIPFDSNKSMTEMLSHIIYAEMPDPVNMTMLILVQYIDICVRFSPDSEDLQHNINAFNILKNNNTIITLCNEYSWKNGVHTMNHNVEIKILEVSDEGIRFKVPVSETEHYEYTLLPTGKIDRDTAAQYIYDNKTLYDKIDALTNSITQLLNTPA